MDPGSSAFSVSATSYGKNTADAYYALAGGGSVNGDLHVAGDLSVSGDSQLLNVVADGIRAASSIVAPRFEGTNEIGVALPFGISSMGSGLVQSISNGIATGYVRLGALLIQWGSIASFSSGRGGLTFPIAYPMGVIPVVSAQIFKTSGESSTVTCCIIAPNSNTVVIAGANPDGTPVAEGYTFFWTSFGPSA